MSIVKKSALGVAGVLVLGGLIFGGNMWSYLRTAGNEVQNTVEGAVPIEFQLKRARDMLANELAPEITRMKTIWARSDVEVVNLDEDLAERVKELTRERSEMLVRYDELKDPQTVSFKIDNTDYTRKELDDDLKSRLDTVESLEGTLKTKQNVRDAKVEAAKQNKAKVARLLQARESLELHIQELEARIEAVKAEETVAGSDFDESKLKRIEDLLGGVEADVMVRERELELDGSAAAPGRIPVTTEETSRSAVDEVNAYLKRDSSGGTVAESEPVEDAPANN